MIFNPFDPRRHMAKIEPMAFVSSVAWLQALTDDWRMALLIGGGLGIGLHLVRNLMISVEVGRQINTVQIANLSTQVRLYEQHLEHLQAPAIIETQPRPQTIQRLHVPAEVHEPLVQIYYRVVMPDVSLSQANAAMGRAKYKRAVDWMLQHGIAAENVPGVPQQGYTITRAGKAVLRHLTHPTAADKPPINRR